MAGDRTTELQSLVARLKAGDESARWELLIRADGRLRRLAATILGQSFPGVKEKGLCRTTDLAAAAELRLAKALEKVELNDVQHFFRLAAKQIRWILLDIVKKARREKQREVRDLLPESFSLRGRDLEAVLEKLLELVSELPEEQYTVVDQKLCLGAEDDEVAELLGVSSRTVRRLWTRARITLAARLKDWLDEGSFDEPGGQSKARGLHESGGTCPPQSLGDVDEASDSDEGLGSA